MVWETFLGALAALTTLFGFVGWSHSALRREVQRIGEQMNHKIDYSEARTLVDDRLEPTKVAIDGLKLRLEELKFNQTQFQRELMDRLDEVLRQALNRK